MYISTEINSFRDFGDNEKVLRLLKDAGFDAYDYSMFYGSNAEREVLSHDDYLLRAKAFRRAADEIGLVCNQAHAPFPTATRDGRERMGMSSAEYNRYAHEKITRAIEVAGVLGAKIIVVHPCNDYTAEQNAELLKSFEKTARKAGVKIALENMWNCENGTTFRATPAACSHHDDFRAHLEMLPKDVFVACLDIGHAEMSGLNTDCVQMIERLGEYLQAVHIHDNDCVHDSHGLPYTMRIDLLKMLTSLKKSRYCGDVTLEADTYIRKFPLELYPHAAKLMAEIASYMREFLSK